MRTSPPPDSALSDRHRSQVGRHDRPRHRASRVARAFLVCMLSPLPRHSDWGVRHVARFPRRISLPRKGGRVGLRIDLFEACSAFTRVTACTLAGSPYVTRHIRGFSQFVTSLTAPTASGRSDLAGWGLHPLEKRRLITAHTLSRHSDFSKPAVQLRQSGLSTSWSSIRSNSTQSGSCGQREADVQRQS